MKARIIFAALAVSAIVSLPLYAQRWRTVDASRQLSDTAPLSVRLEYGAGRIDLKPTSKPLLYNYTLKYDANRSEPVSRFDAASHSLALGLRSSGMKLGQSSDDGGSMRAELSDKLPMELSLELGAVDGDLQLGGLRLTDLSIKSGAADVNVRFDQPNPERLHTITLEVGAAGMKLRHAINSGAERIHATVGVGALDLDLTGTLPHDLECVVAVSMGGFTLRLSPETGVYVDASTFLADFDKTGFVKRGDGWYSSNYDSAPHHVRVRLKAAFSNVTISRDGR